MKPIDLANKIDGTWKRLAKKGVGKGKTIREEVAAKFKIKPPTVSNYRRLLELPDYTQGLINNGQISIRKALVIAQASPDQQEAISKEAFKKSLSRDAIGELINGKKEAIPERVLTKIPPNEKRLIELFSEKLQTPVEMTQYIDGGSIITIKVFYSHTLASITPSTENEWDMLNTGFSMNTEIQKEEAPGNIIFTCKDRLSIVSVLTYLHKKTAHL